MSNANKVTADMYFDAEVALLKEQSTLPAGTTSDKIRALAARGVARADIAKMLSIRYQHVRNVLTTELKRKAI